MILDAHGAPATLAAPPREPAVTEGFQYRREPEDGWRESLAQVSAPSDEIPYLWLAWLPGESHAPVQRWGLWEVIPAAHLDRMIVAQLVRGVPEEDCLLAAIRADLRGLSPRDPARSTEHRSLVNLQQWELWHELNGFATLFWIIQGSSGGHKRSFNQLEEHRLRMLGLPTRPPMPGSLAYAPFDRRVTDQLHRFDRCTKWEGDFRSRVANQAKAVDLLAAERVEARSAAESESDQWLTLQVAEGLDQFNDRRLDNIYEHLPVGDTP